MCTGLALPLPDLPVSLLDPTSNVQRRYVREGREEVQFHLVADAGELARAVGGAALLTVVGRGTGGTRCLSAGWIPEANLHAWSMPERVVIPAVLGFHAGTWFLISTGVAGVVL